MKLTTFIVRTICMIIFIGLCHVLISWFNLHSKLSISAILNSNIPYLMGANNTHDKRDLNQPSSSTNLDQQPKEAFVTFSNNNPRYLALLKVFLDSVHAFSTRPVIAYGIDVDLNVDVKDYPRLIKRRIDSKDCGNSVYFCKIHAVISSNVDYGVLMETDDIVNYSVDVLFDLLHIWPYDYPLSPRHSGETYTYTEYMQRINATKRTTPYIHAHLIWNYRALPFLKELREYLRAGLFSTATFDEMGLNVMYWKYRVNMTLCRYDPYFIYTESYEKWPTVVNCTKYCFYVYITLHGCKEVNESRKTLEMLKANVGKPIVLLPGTKGLRNLNDTTETCCDRDSKPSTIHPLICEHNEP